MKPIIANKIKKCIRCHSTWLLHNFDTNKKGEILKTCRLCLTRDHNKHHEYYECDRKAHKRYFKNLEFYAWKS